MDSSFREQLPASLQDMAEVIGDDDTMKLVENYGGTRIFVPHRMGAQHKLATLLGLEQARKLSNVFGGEALTIAQCSKLFKYKRNEEIRKKYDEGVSITVMVREYGITERQIYAIIASVT